MAKSGPFARFGGGASQVEFNIRHLKNLIFFQLQNNLFELKVLREKKPMRFLLFLNTFSGETDLWVSLMLGDFKVKNAKFMKLEREIYIYLIENKETKVVCGRLTIICSYLCHIGLYVQKDL